VTTSFPFSFHRHESGNAIKDLMGAGHLKWDENKKQGAYKGQKVYDHNKADHSKSLIGHHSKEAAGGSRENATAAHAPKEFPQVGEFYGALGQSAAPPHNVVHADLRQQAEPQYASLEGMALHQFPHHPPHVPHQQHFAQEQRLPLPAHGVPDNRRLGERRRQRHAEEAGEEHVFGNSTAAAILKTRPW
jgi:hypothetical protein